MKNKNTEQLVKNTFTKSENTNTNLNSGCCGGKPAVNSEACCKLDEERKAEGGSGCGCNTQDRKDANVSCC
ncbi:MAG: hypothetical protein IPM96_18555 [Ignavibacteria bacterium]|nr:hypothetical protein [Ignavibacteria bacterium]